MRVLVLTPTLYDTAPGMRFRMEQWARYLESEGFEFTFVPFEDESLRRVIYRPGKYAVKAGLMIRALLRRVAVLRRVREFDVVFLYREAALLGPAVLERLIAWQGVPMVYDFDDPIWMSYRSPTNGIFSALKCTWKAAAICRMAARVMVGNRLLAEWAQEHARQVDIVPSTIDLVHYRPKSYRDGQQTVTLGWTGSHSTLPFLESLHPVLKQLAAQHRFRLLVVSHTDSYSLGGIPVTAKRWRADTEASDLQEIDIGLAPFPDAGWTPWRCHGKVLQYMASGIATVASRLGILPEYISDGEHGYLPANEDEWLTRLSTLIEDTSLRRSMGASGRDVVEQRYSAQIWAPRVGEILKSVAASR